MSGSELLQGHHRLFSACHARRRRRTHAPTADDNHICPHTYGFNLRAVAAATEPPRSHSGSAMFARGKPAVGTVVLLGPFRR